MIIFRYNCNREVLAVRDWKGKALFLPFLLGILRNKPSQEPLWLLRSWNKTQWCALLLLAASPVKSSVCAGTLVTVVWKLVMEGVVFTCRAVLKPTVS